MQLRATFMMINKYVMDKLLKLEKLIVMITIGLLLLVNLTC